MAAGQNILFIMSDQHNAKLINGYGSDIVETPNLTRFANSGVVFDNSYCSSPLCVPSRMSFMASRYPSDIDIWNNDSVLSSGIPTIAHAFGCCGYESLLCGRMHFWGSDQYHGFETRLYGDCHKAISRNLLGSGNFRTNGQTSYALEVSGYGTNGFQEYDDRVTQHACDFINQRNPKDRPFFMVVGMMLPHNPLVCRKDLFDHYMDKIPEIPECDQEYLENEHPAIRKWRERRGLVGLDDIYHRRSLAAYYGLISEMDENIGKILFALENSQFSDNTIIVYCSDHGDQAFEHGLWWKSTHYDASARVPLIFGGSISAKVKEKRCSQVVSLIDVGPTLLELAGCESLFDHDGRSFAPLLKDERLDSWPNEIFCEYDGDHGDRPSCMIRRGDWKLIYYSEFDSYQLFDMANDPAEIHDLRNSLEHSGIAEELLEKIHARWSADKVMKGIDAERKKNSILYGCGHPLIPDNSVVHEKFGEEFNRFDFTQIPNWENINNSTREIH